MLVLMRVYSQVPPGQMIPLTDSHGQNPPKGHMQLPLVNSPPRSYACLWSNTPPVSERDVMCHVIVEGAAYCVTLCLSVRLSVRPVPLLLTLEHQSRVFVNLADVRYLLFCLHARAAYCTVISAAQACLVHNCTGYA